MQGYIKDYRKELESDIWMMPPLYHRIWQYLKYKVNHKKKKIPMKDGSFLEILPGQHLTSIRDIAKKVGWYEGVKWKEPNPKTVKSILDWLVKQSMITVESGNRQYTLITLLNWELYQSNEDEGNSGVLEEDQENPVNRNSREIHQTLLYQGLNDERLVSSNSKVTDSTHRADINKNDKECIKNDIYTATTNAQMSEESDGVPTTDPKGDPVPSGEISQTSKLEEKALLDRFIQLRAKGFHFSPTDELAAKEILSGGVSLNDALEYLKDCFDNYKPKHSRDQINSLSYCVGPILDRYHEKIESQKLTKEFKSFQGTKSQPRNRRSKPIRTELLPDWFDDEQHQQSNKPKQPTDDISRKKAELQETLKKLKAGG